MKIGIVSDVHGNLAGFEACLRELGPVDQLLFAGDLLGYYFDAVPILHRLKELGAICILGNHDAYFLSYLGRFDQPGLRVPDRAAYRARYGPSLEQAVTELSSDELDWIARLPTHRSVSVGGLDVLLCHGSPWSPVDEYVYPDYPDFERFASCAADVIVMGHTHRGFVRMEQGKWLVNPGSAGQPRDGDPRASCALLEIDSGKAACRILRAPYDRGPLIARCREVAADTSLLVELLTRDARAPAAP